MSGERKQDQATAAVVASVKRIRKQRGWSARELSERLIAAGCPIVRTTIANLECGRRETVTVTELVAFADVLGVKPVGLLDGTWCQRCTGAPPEGYICGGCGQGGAS